MRMNAFVLLAATLAVAVAAADERPSFIFYITDDISQDDLGCYGNEFVKTPALDRLASDGLVFENAYLTTSSCSPSRCSIISGRYPHNTGAPELHTSLPEGQPLFPLALREAGYHTVLSGKHHMGSVANAAFVKVSTGRGPGKEADWVELVRERPRDRPFFFWLASSDAHRAWQMNEDAPRYDDDEQLKRVPVPPYLVDGSRTRRDLAEYYHEVSRTDTFAGRLREELERQGVAKSTYFIYCSDNGRPFPRCKTRLHDSGIKTPLIVWAPGRVKPGRTDSLVSAIDFGPTILELAGVEAPRKGATMQGVSFAQILRDPSAVTRDYVFAEHNWHVYQAHERLVRTGYWTYIRNAFPERQNLCVESTAKFPAGAELWDAHAKGALTKAQRDIFTIPRAAEELYDVSADPHQLENLASSDSPKVREALRQLRAVLDRWAEETGDTVPRNPTGDREDARGKKHRGFKRGEFPGAARGAARVNAKGPVRREG